MSTSIGGGGTVWHISLVRTNFPRSTGDVWSGWACTARKLACVRMPARPCAAGSVVICGVVEEAETP